MTVGTVTPLRIMPSLKTTKAVFKIKTGLPKTMERKNEVRFSIPDRYGIKMVFVLLVSSVQVQFR